MISPVLIKPRYPSALAAPVARVIPGMHSWTVEVPRKKPVSVTLDGRYWNGVVREKVPPRPQQKSSPAWLRLLLPNFFFQAHCWKIVGPLLADILVVAAGFAVILLFGLGKASTTFGSTLFGGAVLSKNLAAILVIYFLMLTILGHSEGVYANATSWSAQRERVALAKMVGWSTLLLGVAVQGLEIEEISVFALLAVAPFEFAGMFGWRWLRRRMYSRRSENMPESRNVLIVGAGNLGREIAAALRLNPSAGYVVRGFLDNNLQTGGEVLGRVEDLACIARAKFVDEVIIAMPHQHELAQAAIQSSILSRLDVKLVPECYGPMPREVVVENIGHIPVLTLHEEQTPQLMLACKRSTDFVLSAIGLVCISSLLAAIALCIKFDSSGPVFYRAPRAGKKGKKFNCLKFRTMVTDADKLKEKLRAQNEREGPFFKIAHDPRITRVGGFLRRYSLDELPQLWNVLWGEMSLVGPRPHPLDDFKGYRLEHLPRLDVTPGITGLWQITARRDPSFQRNMALDLEYIERWSLWMDLRILFKTISAVLEGSGA